MSELRNVNRIHEFNVIFPVLCVLHFLHRQTPVIQALTVLNHNKKLYHNPDKLVSMYFKMSFYQTITRLISVQH